MRRPAMTGATWFGLAHSFLAYPTGDGREARALLGVGWGFRIANGAPALVPATRLSPADWDRDVPVMAAAHPDWTFAPGLHG